MGILEVSDHMAAAKSGAPLKEIPLVRIPLGYYMKPNGDVIKKNADHLWIPHYEFRGLELLGLGKDITLETAEACVYLRAIGDITEPEKVKKTRKKRKKKGDNL